MACLTHNVEDCRTIAHQRVTAPQVVLGGLVRGGQLAETVPQIKRRLTRLRHVSDGARAQLRHTTVDSAHHGGQLGNRANDLPGSEVGPVDGTESRHRPSRPVVQEASGDDVDPTATATDSAEAQIDRCPEPGVMHEPKEAISIVLNSYTFFQRHKTLRDPQAGVRFVNRIP